MRLAYFPNLPQNPYQRLFYAALAPHGISARPLEVINDADLRRQAAGPDGPQALHLHWLEGLIGEGSTTQRLRCIISLHRYLRTARGLGLRILWTVHNHQRHDGYRRVDHWGQRVVARVAEVIITHSQWSAGWVQERFHPRGRIVVMPHGNYDGCYPPREIGNAERALMLGKVGLDASRPVAGMIGAVRPYRGHEEAIAAIHCLAGRVQLLVAGWEFNPGYSASLRQQAAGGPGRVAFHLAGIPDEEYARLVRACDVILLPYERVTSSGAILSAWTLARPVVANDLPFFREFLGALPGAGLVAPARDTQTFAAVIEKLLAIPPAQRQAAARAQADRYAWDKVVQPVVAALL